jgi:TolA-binding protein
MKNGTIPIVGWILGLVWAATTIVGAEPLFAQDTPKAEAEATDTTAAVVNAIRIGAHPDYTRIHIDLSKVSTYKVKPDFQEKQILLTLENAELGATARSRTFKDKNLEKIIVGGGGRVVEIRFYLQHSNSRFIHFPQSNPAQIVLDIKGSAAPYLKAKAESAPPEKQKQAKQTKRASAKAKAKQPAVAEIQEKGEPVVKIAVGSLSEEQLQEIRNRDIEDKIRDGWDEYQKALKTYQKSDFKEALKLFNKFTTNHPKSKYLGDIAYLSAEAQFRRVFRDPQPLYERALDAYMFAAREFPKSNFREHALMKMAYIFEELGYHLEARNIYKDILADDPKSPFADYRKLGLARLLVKENKLDDALSAYNKLLGEVQKETEAYLDAKRGVIEVANGFFGQNNFDRALKIFEDVEQRWPEQLGQEPGIHYQMGEIYFRKKNFPHARQHYFDLINIAPDSENGHKALNRVGDSYFHEGKYDKSLAVFDESTKRNVGSREAQYGLIRVADIGITKPDLPLRDLVFDVRAFYHPHETYNKVEKAAVDLDILAEAIMSRGIAYIKEQRYLEAINQFKKLLPLGPDSRYYLPARNYIRQSLIFLVESYSRQGGHMPILYSFTDYQSLALDQINNVKTLVQVGEAYQTVSMHEEAAQLYEKAKSLDTQGSYTARIFLDLGRMHLAEKNYREAEMVARTFLNRYPEDPEVPQAMLVLARTQSATGKRQEALKVFQTLLDREGVDPSEIHFETGKLYKDDGRLQDAIREFTLAIDSYDRRQTIIPQHVPEAYQQLGMALLKNGQGEEAAKVLHSAKELFPEHKFTPWNEFILAESYNKAKNPGLATKEYQNIKLSGSAGELLKKAADTRLKIMDWEKKFKDFL